MIFCIETQLLCKDTFLVGENDLGVLWWLRFSPSGIVSDDSPRKLYLLTPRLRIKELVSGMLNIYSKRQKVCSGKRNALTKTTEKSCAIKFVTLKLTVANTSWFNS